MNRLFVRVFLGFWLTTLLALILGQQVAHYLNREAPRQNALREQHEQARMFVREFSRRYHRQGEERWREWLTQQRTEFDWLLHRPDGEDISGGLLLDSEIRALIEQPPPGFGPRPRPTTKGLVSIKRLHFRASPEQAYLLTRVKRLNPFFVAMFHEHLWLRLLLALLATGTLSYWMVKRYTRPITELRKATQLMAAGDLNIQLEASDSVDEFNALRHDFNQMAQQLQAAQQRQRTLIHDVSHELRTPLARIQAALALASRRQGDSPELERIAQESNTLNSLIDQLLLEPDQQMELSDTLALGELLTSLIEANQLEAESQHIHLALEGADTDIWIQSDNQALRTAIENVLRNAIRHSPPEAIVTLSLEQSSQGDLHIRIRDLGAGVPEEALEKLFLPFYRLDESRQRGSGGHGLGLAICKRIIHSHGGQVKACNREPGLEVDIVLPAELRVAPPTL